MPEPTLLASSGADARRDNLWCVTDTDWLQPDLFGGAAPPPPPSPPEPCPTCDGTGTVTRQQLLDLLADRAGAVGNVHPATSRRAAYRATNVVRFGSQRWKVLAALRDLGPMTAAEVAPHLDRSRNQTATRLLELHDGGLVAYVRDDRNERVTRPTSQHDEGLVHVITPLGVAALRAAGNGEPT